MFYLISFRNVICFSYLILLTSITKQSFYVILVMFDISVFRCEHAIVSLWGWNDLNGERPSFFILLLCAMLRFIGDLTNLIKKISKLAKLWSCDAMKRNAVYWETGLWTFSCTWNIWLSILAPYPLILTSYIWFVWPLGGSATRCKHQHWHIIN